MYFLIGADIVPTESNVQYFVSGEMSTIISDELMLLLNNASYRIFNLEVPLTDKCQPITKYGPNLIAPSSSVSGFKAIGVNLLTLANNHILDQGEIGIEATLSILNRNGINTVGVGDSILSSAEPFIFLFDNKKIGVYACCEHEFSTATESSSGANPFDPLYSFDAVENLDRLVDYVIVLYHGGKEYYRYPSPRLQRICHRFAEKGADLVLCQHSHCIGCEEIYDGSTIVYGQGNFLFDGSDSEYWRTSLLVQIDDQFKITYIPLQKVNNGVSIATKEEGAGIMLGFKGRSDEVHNDPAIINSKYDEFALEAVGNYLRYFSGKEDLAFRLINKLTKNKLRKHMIKQKYTKNEILPLLNIVACEAHLELVMRGLELKVDE